MASSQAHCLAAPARLLTPTLTSSAHALCPPPQVHRSTGEGPEEIAGRKRAAAWGAWLDVPFDAEAAAAAREAAAAAGEEEEGAGGEPAAAAAAVQLEGGAAPAAAQPRRRSGRRSSAAKPAATAAVPEGAGATLLLWAALRWHLLSSAFCAAAQVRVLALACSGVPCRWRALQPG